MAKTQKGSIRLSNIYSTYNGFHVTPNYYSQGYADGSLFRAVAQTTPSVSIPNTGNYWSQVMQAQQNLYNGWSGFGGGGGVNPMASYGQSGAYVWNGSMNAFGGYNAQDYGNAFGAYGSVSGNSGSSAFYPNYGWGNYGNLYNTFSNGAFTGLQSPGWGVTDYSSAFGNFSLGKMNTYAGITAALSFLF